jgi:acyl carrier protein
MQQADSTTLKEIEAIVRDLLDDDDVVLAMDTKPSDVEGWDSLANVSIVFSVEEALGVRLGDDAMANFDTVGDLAAVVDVARGRRAA